jgi:hypothetical protein
LYHNIAASLPAFIPKRFSGRGAALSQHASIPPQQVA